MVWILWFVCAVVTRAQTPSERLLTQGTVAHSNDWDFLAGNDRGKTFENDIKVQWFRQSDAREGAQNLTETTLSLGNAFYTGERKAWLTFTPGDPGSASPGFGGGGFGGGGFGGGGFGGGGFGGSGPTPQTREFSIPSRFDVAPDGRQNTNFLEVYRLGVTIRDWQSARPSDRVKTYLEADISVRYATSSPTATGARLQDAVHSDVGALCYDYTSNQLEYHRLGIIPEMRAGARVDLNRFWSAEGRLGFATDSVALDRAFMSGMTEVSLHLAGDDLLSQRRRALELFVRADGKHYWSGENALELVAGVRACPGPLFVEVSASRTEAVNESLTKGLDQADGDTLYRAEMGLAF